MENEKAREIFFLKKFKTCECNHKQYTFHLKLVASTGGVADESNFKL